jgi:hypothetical protein
MVGRRLRAVPGPQRLAGVRLRVTRFRLLVAHRAGAPVYIRLFIRLVPFASIAANSSL